MDTTELRAKAEPVTFEAFHVSRSGDGTKQWFSARDAASGVSIPCTSRDQAVNLVASLNRAFTCHLRMALTSASANGAGSSRLSLQEELDRRSSIQPMADGGENPMTAAEEVLAWLLVEKIGVPDDVPYSPDQAQEIIAARLDELKSLDRLRSSNEAMRKKLASCQWYWPADDTSSDACSDSPREIAETWDTKPGDIFGYSRGGVVETRYYGFLPAADDADSDDDFEVDEPTEEAAEAKMQAEIARREALSSPIKEKSND